MLGICSDRLYLRSAQPNTLHPIIPPQQFEEHRTNLQIKRKTTRNPRTHRGKATDAEAPGRRSDLDNLIGVTTISFPVFFSAGDVKTLLASQINHRKTSDLSHVQEKKGPKIQDWEVIKQKGGIKEFMKKGKPPRKG